MSINRRDVIIVICLYNFLSWCKRGGGFQGLCLEICAQHLHKHVKSTGRWTRDGVTLKWPPVLCFGFGMPDPCNSIILFNSHNLLSSGSYSSFRFVIKHNVPSAFCLFILYCLCYGSHVFIHNSFHNCFCSCFSYFISEDDLDSHDMNPLILIHLFYCVHNRNNVFTCREPPLFLQDVQTNLRVF